MIRFNVAKTKHETTNQDVLVIAVGCGGDVRSTAFILNDDHDALASSLEASLNQMMKGRWESKDGKSVFIKKELTNG